LDYSPDGAQLASSSSSGVCKLWDPKSAKLQGSLTAHKGSAFWVKYNKEGNEIATCGIDKMVYLYDVRKTKSPLMEYQQKGVVRCVEFLNNDKHIISSNMDGDVMIHDISSGDLVMETQVLGNKTAKEGNICYCVKALSDGLHFMSTHEDYVVRTFNFDLDSKTVEEVQKYEGHTNTVRNLGIGKDEQRIVSCCED
jgi:WD40 repeat protein